MKVGNYKIPFAENGSLMHYATSPEQGVYGRYHQPYGAHRWVDNFTFREPITFSHFSRGRSAAYAIFKGIADVKYCVFLKDLSAIIPTMNKGVSEGPFTFVKRGQNYGLCLKE